MLVWLFARNTKPGSKYLYGDLEVLRQKLGAVATRAYEKSLAQKGRDLQYIDEDVRVEVKNGYDVRHRCFVTDILIFPRDGSGSRYHVIIDSNGNELYSDFHEK